MEKGKDRDGILLESGTNEIEVMKFSVLGESYGIIKQDRKSVV